MWLVLDLTRFFTTRFLAKLRAENRVFFSIQPGTDEFLPFHTRKSALAHFLTYRSTGHFPPSAVFYSARRSCPKGIDLFAPLIMQMRKTNRMFLPDTSCIGGSADLFDANFYLIHGVDVLESSIDPIEHFCAFGWGEGRKPNLYFDTNWYLATNPEVAEFQINPLSHYIVEGESQGRRPIPYFDPVWYRRTYGLEPGHNALAHFLAHRRSQHYSPTPFFDVHWYMSRFGDRVGADRDPFSHYLQFGTTSDIDPSPEFNATEYRRRHMGRISRAFPQLMHPHTHNPLVHHLRRSLAQTAGSERASVLRSAGAGDPSCCILRRGLEC